jgi:hypothetical protein
MLTQILLFTALAQYFGPPNTNNSNNDRMSMPIQGQVLNAHPVNNAQYRIQLIETTARRILMERPLSADGSFTFPPHPIAFYELRVVGLMGATLASKEFHSSEGAFITISAPAAKPAAESILSALRLSHKVPKAARKHFETAMKLLKNPDDPEALEHLKQAVAIDAEFFEAQALLGAALLDHKQFPKARQALEAARKLDPANANNNANLATWHLIHHDFASGELHARQCLRSNPNHARAHYLLAHALIEQGKPVGEIKQHLQHAEAAFPPARELLRRMNAKP